MATELRKTGISVVGDVPWGTHFCYFYETTQDLLDTLVPYFMAGLKSKEFCLWIISNSEQLTVVEAEEALGQALPDLQRYLAEGSIEIITHDEWFQSGGAFDLHRVANQFEGKLDEALARGYVGLRVNGSPAWIATEDRKQFCEFEQQLDNLFPNKRVIASCTYPLASAGAYEIFDVTRRHQFAIAKRCGEWEVIETPELKQAKAEVARLNKELEQRVAERTRELVAANEALKSEIDERTRTEEELRERAADLAEAQRLAKIGNWTLNLRTNKVNWSEELYRIFEIEKRDFDGRYESFVSRIHPDDQQRVLRTNAQTRIEASPFDIEYRIITLNGQVRFIREVGYAAQDEAGNVIRLFGTAQDITERKRAEDKLKSTSEQLRALSGRLSSAREQEGTRIARELHDELGSALTGLKWDLEGIDKLCSEGGNQADVSKVREKMKEMMGVIDATLNAVLRISSELRPTILDDLGLLEAIEWQAQQFEARTGITCQIDSFVENVDLSQDKATAVFRILQEALTNVLRHAHATRVNITIAEEEGEFAFEIRDNGRGITQDESTGSRSLGLIGMRERAHLIGGRIEIIGVRERGTALTLRVPIRGHVD